MQQNESDGTEIPVKANPDYTNRKISESTFKKIRKTSGILFIFSFLLSIGLFYIIKKESNVQEISTIHSVTNDVSAKADELSVRVTKVEPLIESIAEDITSGKASLADIKQRLKNDLMSSPSMYGAGIALDTKSVLPSNAEGKLWSEYYILDSNNEPKKIDINYDYTSFEHSWYRKPFLEGNYWSEPFFGKVSKKLIVSYGVPFWLPGKSKNNAEPSGIVFGNLSIEQIKNNLDFDHDSIAYYYIFSKQGRFIIHPDDKLEISSSSVFELAWENEDSLLNSMAVHAVAGERGRLNHVDPMTKHESWMVYEPVEGPDWSIVVVIDKAGSVDVDDSRQQWFSLIALAIFCIVMLIIFVFLCAPIDKQHPVFASILISIFIFGGIVSLWKVSERYPVQVHVNELKVMSSNILNDFIDKQTESAKNLHMPPPRFIQTGVYLQSVEFDGANNVKISGYVWQHYKKNLHKGVGRGFVLPEAETPNIEEVYREFTNKDDPECDQKLVSRNCDELIGWYVFATLRQEFDYSLYPLDSQQVWLRMWHTDFKNNIILVPDLNAYALPNPKLTPGVQSGFVLPGWEIEESWFSLNDQIFNTNFGHVDFHGLKQKPELFYNINIQREFLNPFVSRIIPVLLILMILFLIILISTKSSRGAEWLGFSASNVVIGLSALFFVIGINHSELRQLLPSSKIMYFEYFYLVIYIMLLYVAVTSIYIAKRPSIEGQDENFVSKILYWPVLSTALFLVTSWVFY